MAEPKQKPRSSKENKLFLSRSYASKEEFAKQYRKHYYGKPTAKELYLQLLSELEAMVFKGNFDSFKTYCNLVNYISNVESPVTLKAYYNASKALKYTNLVILACKYNKVTILNYILGNNSNILNNLSNNIGNATILPDDEDDYCHNAVYYAIRSNNIKLLDTLISKWPKNYFVHHTHKLDKILAMAYEELKLKYVILSDEMEFYVENKLINLRFFSNESQLTQDCESRLCNIKTRIGLVSANNTILNACEGKVDTRFLLVAKYIAQNLHILKQELRSTYDRLPWEEIEYCVVSFISCHTNMNLITLATLNKAKVLEYVHNFAKQLEDVKDSLDISGLNDLPKLKREQIVSAIIDNYPQFEELYNDYKFIRDNHSLEKISNYIKLALSADPKEREGQLTILRAVQMIGEYLKNTLEFPYLSTTTSELLLLTLPTNTRAIVIDSKKTEIEENADVDIFTSIQNDIKNVDEVITDILYGYKVKIIRLLLNKSIDSNNSVEEIEELAEVLNNAELETIITNDFTMLEHNKFEKLIKKLSDSAGKKPRYELDLFTKMENRLKSGTTSNSENLTINYMLGSKSSKSQNTDSNDNMIEIQGMRHRANTIIANFTSKLEPKFMREIVEISVRIFRSCSARMQPNKMGQIKRLVYEFLQIASYGTDDITWVDELRETLTYEENAFIRELKQKETRVLEEKPDNQLFTMKLSELKKILNSNALNNQSTENFSTYKSNKKLQAAIEMLLLDITSILGGSMDYLTNNYRFLDDNTPLLTGKCLRNHLAHGNALADVLFSDPSIAVILNARKLTTENIIKKKKKLGKLIRDDPFVLKYQYQQALMTIVNQEKMFAALEEGNLEGLESCLKNGTDIYARSIKRWNTLHFAAKGPSLELVKYLVDQNINVNAKNNDGENPLHIAATCGRANIVEFLIKKIGMNIDGVDNWDETALHNASQNGHIDAVQVLLKHKANVNAKNIRGLSPLYYAVRNNHGEVVKALLGTNEIDINESLGGYAALHQAADDGNIELVEFLLKNNADINVRNENDWTPLHAAVFSGHLDAVNYLILKGADVNARILNGCTPLFYAVENGNDQIVNLLLEHGASVNAIGKTCDNSLLHIAARDGYEEIVKTLLKYGADANVANAENQTPLHFAAKNQHMEIVVALLEHGVDIHAKSKTHATALHSAVESGDPDIVNLLIKNEAVVNVKDMKDTTPLHMATFHGHNDIVELLIKNNADVNAVDIKGSTPLHAAALHGRPDAVDLLIENKADINAKTNDGITPLYSAVLSGSTDAAVILVANKAEVNVRAVYGLTPLHAAVMGGGYLEITRLLLKNQADINVRDIIQNTPLHYAVESGSKEIVETLLANGADIHAESRKKQSLVSYACLNDRKEIVEVLLTNGAKINAEDLSIAVFTGYKDIIDIMLQNKVSINAKQADNTTLLHLAAKRGHTEVVFALITNGANVNATDKDNIVPIHCAAQEGHTEIIELLISKGANVNADCVHGTPLHLAAGNGHKDAVEVLLKNAANFKIRDKDNRTSLELAVAHNQLDVVKLLLLQSKKADINDKGNCGWTLLHIAAMEGNLEIVKYLLNEGADINAHIDSGSMAIHLAAREGRKNIVEFLLNNGSKLTDRGANDQTMLHYATIKGQSEVMNYLIEQGVDVNAKDIFGRSSVHLAANYGSKDIMEILLNNNAIYNSVDNSGRKPLDLAVNKDVVNLLASTERLFFAVHCNSILQVENSIRAGAFVNAKDIENGIPLHYAAWYGWTRIATILLESKSNPNAVGTRGFTPLHYASMFCHINIVKVLLFYGAIYDAVSDIGITPVVLAKETDIIELLTLVSESFKKIEHNNTKIIDDLNKIQDIDTIKAIMSARNRDNKSLIIVAIQTNFSEIERLKEILQDDVSTKISEAFVQLNIDNGQKALGIFKTLLEKRIEILGPDNPGTLDIQMLIARVLFKQRNHSEALDLLDDIFQKQKEMLGMYDKDTLNTRSLYAFILHKLGRDEEAYNIYNEIYQRQIEAYGARHSNTLDTQLHLALCLERLGNYEEALRHSFQVFEERKKTLGSNDDSVLRAQNNIGLILAGQNKFEEALKIYDDVFEKKRALLGANHSDTLKTQHNIANILYKQGKCDEALKIHEYILNIQIKNLGAHHHDALNSQYNIANILFAQGKWIESQKIYNEILEPSQAYFGKTHASVLDILKKTEQLQLILKVERQKESANLQHLHKDINIAANNGDIQTVRKLLKIGVDINETDAEGRTPLHYAITNGHIDLVKVLLENEANVTHVTNKGNTALHIATTKGHQPIIELLLQHVNRNKLNDFINAKTTATGTTALHIAADKDFLDVIKSLLKHGAIYNIENKAGETSLDLAKDQNACDLFKLIDVLFHDVKSGNEEVISKLNFIEPDELAAVTNARNNEGKTLLQVAITNKRKNIATELLKLLKK